MRKTAYINILLELNSQGNYQFNFLQTTDLEDLQSGQNKYKSIRQNPNLKHVPKCQYCNLGVQNIRMFYEDNSTEIESVFIKSESPTEFKEENEEVTTEVIRPISPVIAKVSPKKPPVKPIPKPVITRGDNVVTLSKFIPNLCNILSKSNEVIIRTPASNVRQIPQMRVIDAVTVGKGMKGEVLVKSSLVKLIKNGSKMCLPVEVKKKDVAVVPSKKLEIVKNASKVTEKNLPTVVVSSKKPETIKICSKTAEKSPPMAVKQTEPPKDVVFVSCNEPEVQPTPISAPDEKPPEPDVVAIEPPNEVINLEPDEQMSDKDPKKSQESWRKYIFKPPKGISLPDLTDIDGPYSLQHPQLDGTIAYLLKEHQESTLWISNFDLSTLRCDICNEHSRSIRALVVHRRKLHFFQGNSVDCAACGTLCHFFAEQISHTLYCPKRESIVIGFCSLCQQQFESHDHFEEHFKKKHAKKQKRPGKMCLFCNKNIWPNKYNNHMRAHHTEIQQDIEKNTPVDQKLWKIVRFQTIPVGVKLPNLNKVFSMYKNPFTTMVPQPDETNAYLTGIGENIWITNFDLAALKCDICALTFNSITPFIVHRRDYHFFPANSKSCTGCALEVFGTFKLSHSLYCPRRKDIIAGYCPMCKTYFHQRGEYIKHIDAKMELNSFKKEQELSECTLCGKFVLRLDQHMKWHAFPSPMHECAHCQQQFRLLIKLQEHLAAKHFPSLLRHVCEKCLPQRRFWTLHQLHRHEKIVHSDKKVQCRHCEKFYSYNCISRHQKACLWQKKKLGGPTIVKKTPQRKRKDDGGTCHICGKIFRLEASCRAHMYIHLPNEEKPHKCDYCDKRFIAMVAKLEHERDHTGEKPFVCQYCSKAFAKNQTFRDHIRTHTGDGYKCSHCDRMTFDHSSFRKHLKTHEAELGVKLTYTREERRLKRIGLLEELQGTNYL